MSYEPVEVIEVRAWGRSVGAVALNPSTGWYAFEYRDEWLDSAIELAPLRMPNRPGSFEFNKPDIWLTIRPLL